MSRRKAAVKRSILPDPLFNSELIAKFINCVMKRGKKSVAESIVYGALQKLIEREDDEGGSGRKPASNIRTNAAARESALRSFEKALDNVKPAVEVKSRRVGGSTYQVPVEIRPDRRVALGMRWLVDYASQRGEKTMGIRLAGEITDAAHNRGGAVKKRDDVHKMAKANQAFAHYRW